MAGLPQDICGKASPPDCRRVPLVNYRYPKLGRNLRGKIGRSSRIGVGKQGKIGGVGCLPWAWGRARAAEGVVSSGLHPPQDGRKPKSGISRRALPPRIGPDRPRRGRKRRRHLQAHALLRGVGLEGWDCRATSSEPRCCDIARGNRDPGGGGRGSRGLRPGGRGFPAGVPDCRGSPRRCGGR